MFDKPNYKDRYEFFLNEYVSFNVEIPDDDKLEYEALFLMLGKQQESDNIFENLQKFKVSISDKIPMPDIVLSICDTDGNNKRMVMTRQNISCITAKAKVGKTFLVKLIVGSILQKGVFQNRLYSDLPTGKDRILYIDTEQSKYHVQLGMNQIYTMLGEEYSSKFGRLDVYQFDSVATMKRFEYVKFLIYNNDYDVVILDGISDLILDSNSLKDSDELVTNLRIWATERNLHIINVIHQNPSDLTEKMKGHLGTKLQDKSEIVIGVSIDKDNDNNRIVQSLASRNRKPDPFQFTILDTGVPEIDEEEVSNFKITGKKEIKGDKPDHEMYQILTCVFSKKQTEMKNQTPFYRYSDLLSQIGLEYEKKYKQQIGDSICKKLLTKFIDKEWILKSGEPKFTQYFLGEFAKNYDVESSIF